MDILQESFPYLLYLYNLLTPYFYSLQSLISTISSFITPIALPLLNRLLVLTQDSPAIVTLGLLLLVLVISMQILNLARRMVLFWTRILFTVVLYGGLVLVVLVVWQRGVGRTVAEMGEWAEEIRRVWWMEYRRWEGYQNQGRQAGGVDYGYGGRGAARTGWR